VAGCRAAGIPVTELGAGELARREPLLAPGIKAAFHVPDAVCYTMSLCRCLVQAARESGSELLNWHRFDSFLMERGGVAGGRAVDLRSGEVSEIRARLVVNAAGAWGAGVLRKAGLDIPISFNRGAMLCFEGRLVGSVVQRLRWPSDFDAVMPRGGNSVAGTTGVPTTDPGDRRVEPWEKEKIREQVSTFLPALKTARLVHAWAGVRPLYDPRASSEGRDSRSLSRRFEVLDHEKLDGLSGLLTVVGGKLAIYRLMAEKVTDAACRKLGKTARCTTASAVLCPVPA
jgi:glycerol-3-phosphate dehydrogenase